MDTFTFNIAKGREIEFYNRVESNDPAASALVVIPMATGGTTAQGEDLDDFAAVEADANFSERTTGGWVRKTLTDVQLAAFPVPDDTNNRYAVQVPQITFTAPLAANNVVGFIICYDADTAAGTDAALLPLTSHNNPVTTDGNDVTILVGDFVRAS